MLKYFGTDGFRGEAGNTLTAEHAFKIGRFLGWYYSANSEKSPKIAIGKDTRRSSYMLEYAVASGICSSGADAYMLHVTTTPSVSYVVNHEDFDCGIMISASHNKFSDNGIKLVNSSGEKMEEETLELIELYLDGEYEALGLDGDIPYQNGEKIGRIIDFSEGRNRYVGYLISLSLYSYKGFRVALDCANGASWAIAKSVFDALGASTFTLATSPDGTNINKLCGSTDTSHLRRFVIENRCDIGFAFDGDADRCIAVDENGREVDGDKLLYVLALEARRRGELVNDTVVTTVMSNYGLYAALEREGIKQETTSVGDKYVWENMVKTGNSLGGESSGHIIFKKYATTGDGILTAIKTMEAVISAKSTLSLLTAPVQLLAQKTVNVQVSDKDAVMNNDRVKQAVEKISADLEGHGRVLLRKSGTEPVIRIMTESETDAICIESCEYIRKAIEEEGLLK
jgi:phosphoglucosamine mutase